MVRFIPLYDMVLIQTAKEPEKTKGGIILPDASRKKPDEGIIVDTGPDVKAVKKGQRVVFGRYVGVELTIEGVRANILIHETDILGILEGKV